MEIIEQIGSYAGLAAIVGLAVLSALYFSQARDVKRLREWAGRAPERAPTNYPHRVVARPAQPPRTAPPQGGPPPPPVPVPPGAQPAAAGAGPAVVAGPVAATPAAARAAETPTGADGRQAASQNTVAHPPPRPPPPTLAPRQPPPGMGGHFAREAQIARQREEAQRHEQEPAQEGPATEDDQLEDEHGDEEYVEDEELGSEEPESEEYVEDEELESHEFDARDNGPLPEAGMAGQQEPARPAVSAPTPPPPPPPATASNRPLPPRPAPPGPRSASPQGPILPPYEKSRPGGASSWENRTFSPMKAGLAVLGTVVFVAAAAFGVLQLTGGDDPPTGSQEKAPSGGGEGASNGKGTSGAAGGVNPRSVTVSVLNGTTVGGLARQLADRLEGQGFELGNVTNNTDQQRAESVVLYAPGAEAEARDVGRRLKINQREPIDPDSQTRAGDARVVVVTGNDLNE